MELFKTLKEEALDLQSQLVSWRRNLHEIPELGMETVKTGEYICHVLDGLGIPYRKNVAGHGVVALLKGSKPGKVFALRADCDGLPIKEETGLPFASRNGCMHACGHDVHTAMALGAGRILSSHRDDINGAVKFIFQPGEEGCKEGPGGAKRMIDDGALEDPSVDAILGFHTGAIWKKDFKPGDVGFSYGGIMACMDRFDLEIDGKGSHGAYPQGAVDPVSIASHIVSELQTVVSREMDPTEPAVISIGEIHAGSAFNIIPGKCVISGTVRALKQETREFIAKRIEEVASGVAGGMRGSIRLKYGWEGPPPVVNDAGFTEEFRKVAAAVVGGERVKEIKRPSMGGEDFAFYLEKVTGTFVFLPSCDEAKGQIYPHHNSKFTIDESVMWVGPAVSTAMAVEWLRDHS